MIYRGLSGQSAIEYLMTYGWMLLVVAIVGGAIFSTVDDQNVESINGFTGSDVQVADFGVKSSGALQLELRDGSGQGSTVSAINVTDESTGKYIYKEFNENNTIDVGENTVLELPNVSQGDGSNSLNVEIVHGSGGLENITSSGTISGNLQVSETVMDSNDGGDSQTVIVDNFEDGDISEYKGNTDSFSTSSTYAYNGTNSLSLGAYPDVIISTSGLDDYPAKGENFEFYSYYEVNPDFGIAGAPVFIFGESSGETGSIQGYGISPSKSELVRFDGGLDSSSTLDSGTGSSSGEWSKTEIEWGDTITATIYDSGGNQIEQLSSTDTTYSGTNIGWFSEQDYIAYVDYLKIN